MTNNDCMQACEFLGHLYGEKLCFWKKCTLDRPHYHFGFGKSVIVCGSQGKEYEMPMYNVLANRVDVVWRTGEKKVLRLRENTPNALFEEAFNERLNGLIVESVEMYNDNRLLLDLSDYWIILLTNEAESWELGCLEDKLYRVVATNSTLSISEKVINIYLAE